MRSSRAISHLGAAHICTEVVPHAGPPFVVPAMSSAELLDAVVAARGKLDLMLRECEMQHTKYGRLCWEPPAVKPTWPAQPWEQVFWKWMESVLGAHQQAKSAHGRGHAEAHRDPDEDSEERRVLEGQLRGELERHSTHVKATMRRVTATMGSAVAAEQLKEVCGPINEIFSQLDSSVSTGPVLGVDTVDHTAMVDEVAAQCQQEMRRLQSEAKQVLESHVDTGSYRLV